VANPTYVLRNRHKYVLIRVLGQCQAVRANEKTGCRNRHGLSVIVREATLPLLHAGMPSSAGPCSGQEETLMAYCVE